MTVAPVFEWLATGRRQRPSAVRKVEARLPAPDPVLKVATNLWTWVDGDPGGLKRRGGSSRHGRWMAVGTGLGKVRGWSSYAFTQGLTNRHQGLTVFVLRSRASQFVCRVEFSVGAWVVASLLGPRRKCVGQKCWRHR